MLGSLDSICKKSWLRQGFILQISQNEYFLGQGGREVSFQPFFGFYSQFFWDSKLSCWWLPEKCSFVTRQELIHFLNLESEDFSVHFEKMTSPSFVEFQNIFYQIQDQIKQTSIQKVVPAFYEQWKGAVQPLYFLSNFFKAPTSYQGYLYGFWNSSHGFLGCSPEILFSVKKSHLYTMALAGTADHLNSSFIKDIKERKEHNYVIQSIEESLKEEVDWKHTSEEEISYGSIKHLCQHKEGELKVPFHFNRIVQKLHPTAALGAYPQREGLCWLKKQPSQRKRKHFGSPVGCVYGHQGFCLVAIRGLEWQDSLIKIYSGAGIVQESSLQKEWRELFLKREQIKQAFFKNKDIHRD